MTTTTIWSWAKHLAAVLGLAALTACDSGSNSAAPPVPEKQSGTQDTLQAAKAAGRIRIGYANEAPYAFMDSQKARVTGEAVEVARVVLKRMGINEVEGVLTEFGSLIPGLQAKRFDIIAAGMYVTPERCQQVAFSNPTYGVDEGFLVPKGNPKQLHSFEDVANKEDVKLGVVVGAIEADYARQSKVGAGQMVVFPDAVSAFAGVQAGRADAYAATALTINDLLNKTDGGGGMERAQPFKNPVIDGKETRGYGAFAFRKEDKAFADAFNAELAKFIGTEEHAKLVAPFGFTKAELPGEMTAAKLCGTP
ncbi:ectoine/hydroxyectoine ABC transporter substrate-binding protein EhuB [Bordetella hinzii]|uniref:Ectoine/hydroxyectoine ABC transporter substrate-binding protein EhuB n=1 Tax=Bordetella hinzii TaxID=103855 RepID=A0AAN1VHP4_9BORD|nr:ectoine/hydroxyectoine ABC transporter substrate-binding protein EhuB [Bordetella hinzii]AKQ55214.1 putative amino-acid ABC transporter-binding protein precursor [Bordetella hinzii]AKQ59662.1 putative amino-acid ABC transporter-binding protein precursor [Bordetella hinzii]AZW19211.1 ectoine/hydroxyectoine ABC transporter substrate-binding protein EhuB [Bordetella hinzii]KCB27309.1 ectoine/hydroxyectoine ABC transporter solute-binding protein EhuB [Bordetella hinzii L60]KCB48035.1 ectoine/hy